MSAAASQKQAEPPLAQSSTPSRAALAASLVPVLDCLSDHARCVPEPDSDSGWVIEAIPGGLDAASSVFRLRAAAATAAESPWSLILKVVRPLPDREHPASAFYWRREASAYGSGVLEHLADGLVAPKCYGVEERGGEVWLWLEDVARDGAIPGRDWTPEQVLAVTRRYGALGGAYLSGARPLPTELWAAHGTWRPWLERAEPGITRLAGMRGHPAVQACFPDGLDEAILRFWHEDRHSFVQALERLPSTLHHGDPGAMNLFLRPGNPDSYVAIDFAWLAVAPLGLDLSGLINTFRRKAPGGDQAAFADRLTEAYAEGLREAGWQGDTRVLPLAWRLSRALRYFLNPLILDLFDEAEYARMARSRGFPTDDYTFMRSLNSVVRDAYATAMEAREYLRASRHV